MHFDDFVGIAHEAVRQLADVDEPVLMHADVHKRAERCDIGDDARQLHALFEILHRAHAFGKGKGLEGASRVASGFFQFLHDVGERGQAELVRDIVGKADGLAAFGALHEFADGCARILGHALDHGVGFRVHGAGVEGLLAVPDA